MGLYYYQRAKEDGGQDKRIIKHVNSVNVFGYGANTCVRVASKGYQMKSFGISFGIVDPTISTIAAYQKDKFDKMKK